MSEWQPIDTAPKDGTDVLAWSPLDEECIVVYWDGQSWCAGDYLDCRRVTHWQPLPPPPEVK